MHLKLVTIDATELSKIKTCVKRSHFTVTSVKTFEH